MVGSGVGSAVAAGSWASSDGVTGMKRRLHGRKEGEVEVIHEGCELGLAVGGDDGICGGWKKLSC